MNIKRLKELKNLSGLTNEKISKKSGVPLSTVTRIMSGQTDNPSVQTIKELVSVMGGSLDYIFELDNPKGETEEDNSDNLLNLYKKVVANKNRTIHILSVAIAILGAVIVFILLYDVLNGSVGYIRY